MEIALYHSDHGYYSRPEELTVTREGDFMTSVSVGPCFGLILAYRLRALWEEEGQPENFTILELGAHDGSLASDILTTSASLGSDFEKSIHYHIAEPLETRRLFLQKNLLPRYPEKITLHTKLPKNHPHFVTVIANEVLDALPVSLLHFHDKKWHELQVTHDGSQFHFTESPDLSPELINYTQSLGHDFPDYYVTEAPADFAHLLQPIDDFVQNGRLLFFDYGFDQETLTLPTRKDGTLRAYCQHRKNHHPLERPGLQDLTAHVNFTAFIEAAHSWKLCELTHQGRYLTHAAKPWLLSSPSDPNLIRQFQTLTHPNHFGTTFHAIEMKTHTRET
nr:protein arginine methyltransferase NDUFAF7 homolog, mitochondrial-like [Nerophis lumbriciformis]